MERAIIGKFLDINDQSQMDGFTLVELVIAMAISGIVMASVMTSFLSQHRSYIAQDDVAELQQNGRVAMEMLASDIRMAGYDPNSLGAGITTADVDNLVFTRDDGTGALETISYALIDAFTTESRNDEVVDDLGRDEGGGPQPVAENISLIEFRYLDENGKIITAPVSAAELSKINSILVFILAVANRPDPKFSNTMTYTYDYTSPSPDNKLTTITSPTFNDNFRRRLFVTTVKCRNIGL